MRHKNFVVATTVMMLGFAAVVTGLAFYSSHVATASTGNVPSAIHYLPASSQGVFGMNVQKFTQSPLYKKLQAEHGDKVGQDLQEFIAKTGVDPLNDVRYIVAAGRSGAQRHGAGVMIAVGTFRPETIIAFIKSEGTPIEVQYRNATVLMIPESDGNQLDKGIAFLKTGEIALGDLESLKQVLDVQAQPDLGIDSTPLGELLRSASIDLDQMFWFAGDAGTVMAKAPANTPFGTNLSSIRTIFGTLDMSDIAITGKITAVATTSENADKLRDIVRGLVALGQMAASSHNPDLAALANQIKLDVASDNTNVVLNLNIPYDLIEKLEQLKTVSRKGI